MPEAPKFHDENLMPVTMGLPYRVPDYAYPNWGLTFQDEGPALAEYRREWEAGTAAQLQLVTTATIEAGLGDYPELLRRKAAAVTAKLLGTRDPEEAVKILDLGSGPGLSTLAVYEALASKLQRNTRMLLLEPSMESLQAAGQLLDRYPLRYTPHVGTDLDMLTFFRPHSIDVITAVASIHHHAQIPFDIYYRFLKPGGFLVIADWHQPLWEHPGAVLRFLQNFDWDKKEEGLTHWQKVFPQAEDLPPFPEDQMEKEAIEQIILFWLAYAEIAARSNLGSNAIWPLEGHRPVKKYVEGLHAARFSLDTPDIRRVLNGGKLMSTNPHQVLTNSTLLQITVAQKV